MINEHKINKMKLNFFCHSTMLVNQVMIIVLLCLYLFCENHYILFVSVLWILFCFVCICSALLLFCFHVVSRQWRRATTTFDSAVAVPSLSKIQMIICHPISFAAAV